MRKKIPLTFWAMMIGTLAITGVGIPLTYFGFAGFFSKDAIIESAFAAPTGAGSYAFWLLVVAAFMTSFYSWRLMFLTFFGEPRDKHHYDEAHESPPVMTIPLGVLAVGSVFAGVVWYSAFFDKNFDNFFGMTVVAEAHAEVEDHAMDSHAEGVKAEPDEDGEKKDKEHHGTAYEPGQGAVFMREDNHVMHDAHYVPIWVKASATVVMILGFALAWVFYIWDPAIPKRLAKAHPALYQFLLNKWYFDEIFDFLFVKPAMWLGRFFWKKGDGATIDGFLNGLAMGTIPFFTKLAGRAQSGYLFHYAFAMLIGLGLIISWVVLRG